MKKLILRALALLSIVTAAPAAAADLGDKTAASPSPEWLENAVIYEANLRQGTPTRDLKGLQLELPRLKDLGVDVVWLMPIHPISEKQRKGKLGSYYAVRDYKGVNPEFGTFEDLQEFVRTAHSLGMKVILDEVCNHTGADHPWVTEHPDYYARNDKGEMFGPYDWTDVYKLDYTNPGAREAMIDALEFWVRDADIDGYRCDVAGEVLTDFWEEARPRLQAIKPVLMLAEADKPELLLNAFDIDYAWPMKDVFNAIALTKGVNEYAVKNGEKRPKMDARDIPALVERQKKQYPQGSVHMNMITNHDLNSWEGTEFERFGPATGTFAVISYILPGAPMMYTGQETGFNHAFEFFDRDSIQPSRENNEFTVFYEALNGLKHKNRALRTKAPAKFYTAASNDLLTLERSAPVCKGDKEGKGAQECKEVKDCCKDKNDRVILFANLSNEPLKVDYGNNPVPEVEGMVNYFTAEPGAVPMELAPWQYILLVNP